MVDRRLGNRIGVVTDVIFVVRAVFADVISYDGSAILEVDGIRLCTRDGKQPYKEDGDT